MSHLVSYKGYYVTKIEFDDEDGLYSGVVADLVDIIHFQGATLEEAHQSFRDGVDDYLEFCAELGDEPDKPFTGTLVLRLSPTMHRKLTKRARREKAGVESFVMGLLERAAAEEDELSRQDLEANPALKEAISFMRELRQETSSS